MRFNTEVERETDGRWIAEIPEVLGAMAYGNTEMQACARARAIALRAIATRSADTSNTLPPQSPPTAAS